MMADVKNGGAYDVKPVDVVALGELLIDFTENGSSPQGNPLLEANSGGAPCNVLAMLNRLGRKTAFIGKVGCDTFGRQLRQQYDIPLVLVTLGADGSRAYYKAIVVEEPAFLQQKTIETTGAGDTFTGCVLHFVLQYGMEHLTEEILHDMLRFANAGASLITTRKGALKVMPTKHEIEMLLVDSHCPENAVP